MIAVDVVDLDGTLIRVNSFPRWVRFSIASSLARRDLGSAAAILAALTARKTRLISHNEFKRRLLGLELDSRIGEGFALQADTWSAEEVIARVKASGADYRVLATAAPRDYVGPIADRLGLHFDAMLTSSLVDRRYVGLSQATKRDEVIAHLTQAFGRDAFRFTLYTDHEDDLPLARQAAHVVLCNPGDAARSAFLAEGRETEILTGPQPSPPGRLQPFDVSAAKDFGEACAQLNRLVEERFGRADLVVGIANGGEHIARAIAALREDEEGLMIVRRQRRSTAVKQRRLSWVVRRLPDRTRWSLRRCENALAERSFRYGPANQPAQPVVVLEDAPAGRQPGMILVVDDAVDSGSTLSQVVDSIGRRFPGSKIVTAVLATSFAHPGYRADVTLRERAMLRGPWSMDVS